MWARMMGVILVSAVFSDSLGAGLARGAVWERAALSDVLARPVSAQCADCVEDEIGDLGIFHMMQDGSNRVLCWTSYEGASCHSWWVNLPCWHGGCEEFDGSVDVARFASASKDWRDVLRLLNDQPALRVDVRRGAIMVANCDNVLAAMFPLEATVADRFREISSALENGTRQ